ncbi:MAG: hypothetical protein IKD06_00655 [Clostridia bacterium]|nr:hypothetical protein [Clostridia bacterium]
METITRVSYLMDVTVVTLTAKAAQREFITKYFESLSENDVNVDMISQSAPMDRSVRVSFTADDAEVAGVLKTTSAMRNICQDLRTEMNSQNVKLTFFGEKMSDTPGVAAKVLRFFLDNETEPVLITTSLFSITCIINSHDFMRIRPALTSVFGELTDKFVQA